MNYQQILAETYQESAGAQEHHSENEDDYEPDVDGHAEHDYDTKEIPDPDAFKRFGGNRGHPETIPKPVTFDDKSKISMRYEKDVQTTSFNIDSRFRDYSSISQRAIDVVTSLFPNRGAPALPDGYLTSNPANFIFTLPRTIKNVYSVALTSIEFPNTFYEFDTKVYKNTTFQATVNGVSKTITIRDGNYDTPTSLCTEVQTALTTSGGEFIDFKVKYDSVIGKISISNPNNTFSIKFPTSIQPTANGIGYFLGFQKVEYFNSDITNQDFYGSAIDNTLTAEGVPTILSNNYIYLALNDWDVITHRDFNNSHFYAFAKIMVPAVKYTVVYDSDSTNTTIKEVFFQQPKDVNKIAITLFDPYGNILNLQGADFSFTLELKQILNMNLYEKLREL